MKTLRVALIALALGPFAHPSALAADADRMQSAVETRQGLLKVVRAYFGPMVAMARGDAPYDADRMAEHAHKVRELAGMLPYVFSVDTRGADVDTDALPGIWENMDDFRAKANTLHEAAMALETAVGEGQAAAMAAFRKTGGACKGCHDEYRKDD